MDSELLQVVAVLTPLGAALLALQVWAARVANNRRVALAVVALTGLCGALAAWDQWADASRGEAILLALVIGGVTSAQLMAVGVWALRGELARRRPGVRCAQVALANLVLGIPAFLLSWIVLGAGLTLSGLIRGPSS